MCDPSLVARKTARMLTVKPKIGQNDEKTTQQISDTKLDLQSKDILRFQ